RWCRNPGGGRWSFRSPSRAIIAWKPGSRWPGKRRSGSCPTLSTFDRLRSLDCPLTEQVALHPGPGTWSWLLRTLLRSRKLNPVCPAPHCPTTRGSLPMPRSVFLTGLLVFATAAGLRADDKVLCDFVQAYNEGAARRLHESLSADFQKAVPLDQLE